MLRLLLLLVLLTPQPGRAETLVTVRTIRSQAILTQGDLTVIGKTIPGTLDHLDQAVGLETRVVLYAGRPIRPDDVGPPALIDRNQIVTLLYRRGTLLIAADARAMGRAGIGDSLRVMNLTSRAMVTGIVQADGTITVGGPDISRFK